MLGASQQVHSRHLQEEGVGKAIISWLKETLKRPTAIPILPALN